MESITGNAIGFFSMSTFRAFSARIPWIYNFAIPPPIKVRGFLAEGL